MRETILWFSDPTMATQIISENIRIAFPPRVIIWIEKKDFRFRVIKSQ